MANGRYTQNIFTPQVEPYDIGGDILKAMMREQGMRRERESQVMEMAQYMDPVKLTSDQLILDQHEMINTVGDDIAAKMKAKKGRLTTDDMLNIQFQIRGVREWQQKRLAEQDIYTKHSAMFNDPRNANKFDPTIFGQLSMDYVTKGVFPASKSFLEVNAINYDDFLNTFEPFKKPSTFSTKNFTGANKEKTQIMDQSIYGPYTAESSKRGTPDDPAWMEPRLKLLSNQLLSSEAHMKGARQKFYGPDVTDEERFKWEQQALTMNSTPNMMTQDAQGNSVDVDGAYLWGMDYGAEKIQQTQTDWEYEPTPVGTLKYYDEGEGDTEAGAIEWTGVPNEIEITTPFPSKSGTRDVTYSSEDTATLTEVKLGSGADAARVNVSGDYFIVGGNIKKEWLGKSINEEGPKSSILINNTYQLAAKPRVEKGMRVYMGDDVELKGFITEERGLKKKKVTLIGNITLGKDAPLKLVHGMPIDDEIYKALVEEAKTNPKAQEILDNSPQKNVAHIQLKTGAYKSVELMRVYDKDLANELGAKFFEYEESENDNWWEK